MQSTNDSSDLLGFVSSLGSDALRVEESLGEGYVRLRVSEAERRQAKHDIRCIEDVAIELLRNSRDAGARRIFVATSRVGTTRQLVVLDDGRGIPSDMWSRVFDARVTSKLDSMVMDRWGVHGRGMALFSIRENVKSAMVMDSAPGLGTSIRVTSDTSKLPERADQSTWPEVRGTHERPCLGKGPHNVVRVCCEFALEERGCNVYVGSPAEIIATIRERIPAEDPSLKGSEGRESVLGSIARASGPRQLAKAAGRLGLEVSERTAQRVVSHEVTPLKNIVSQLMASVGAFSHTRTSTPTHSVRSIRLSPEDSASLSATVRADVENVAQKYYAHAVGNPTVHMRGNTLLISVEITPDQ